MKLNFQDFSRLNLRLRPISWYETIHSDSNHSKFPYVDSMHLLTNGFTLWIISDLLKHWQQITPEDLLPRLNSTNWMYGVCCMLGFRKGIQEIDINIYANALKHDPIERWNTLEKLPLLTYEEVAKFYEKNPVVIKDSTIINGVHRICSSIHSLIQNQHYVAPKFIELEP